MLHTAWALRSNEVVSRLLHGQKRKEHSREGDRIPTCSRFVFRPSSCSGNFSPVREESEIVISAAKEGRVSSVSFLLSAVFRDISLLHAHYSYDSDLHSCE